MIRLLVLYSAAGDREALVAVEAAARSLRALPGLRTIEASREVVPVDGSEGAGPVVALGFADVDAMRRAMATDAWRRATEASPHGPPALRAYEVREMVVQPSAEALVGATDVAVGRELEAEPEPAEPISTQIDFPSARLRAEEA